MTLICEDGTGLSTAESYASVAAADTRLGGLGLTTWSTITNTEKEQALRRATVHMATYRSRWKGARVNTTQALDWPRYGAEVDCFYVASNVVPAEVANACIDLALKAAAGDLNPDLERGIVREKVGPLETEYDPYSPQSPRYPAIDALLAPLLKGSGVNAMLIRA